MVGIIAHHSLLMGLKINRMPVAEEFSAEFGFFIDDPQNSLNAFLETAGGVETTQRGAHPARAD